MRRALLAGLVLPVLAGLSAGAVFAGAGAAARPDGLLWLDKGLHAVSTPVAAGGHILVYVTGPAEGVSLEAIDPATGAVVWKLPHGYSSITAGERIVPDVVHGVVLGLIPEPSAPRSGLVELVGIDAATGTVRWHSAAAQVVDPPSDCARPLGKAAFCVGVYAGRYGLIALKPVPGKQVVVKDVGRGIGPGLYQTEFSPATFAGVRVPGGIRWSRLVAELFGSPDYSPDYGWNFEQYGGLDVGSVGNKRSDLSKNETIALSLATGKVVWRAPGTAFDCLSLPISGIPVRCRMAGTVLSGANQNVTITLEGFAPATGKATWHVAVTNFDEVIGGTMPLADSSHLVMTTGGRRQVVDLHTGRAADPSPGQIFWCSHENQFATATKHQALRYGSDRYTTCDADGQPVAGIGAPADEVGVTVGKTFVWARPDGLAAAGA